MNTNTPKQKTITELVIGLIEMHENMTHIIQNSQKEYHHRVIHYVGQNYDLHIDELRRRGQHTIADKYQTLSERWRA